MTIIVSGMIAADPHQGGATWAVLQYVLGLRGLGHEVILIEPLTPPKSRPADWKFETCQSAAYFQRVVKEFGLEKKAALLLAGTERTIGLGYAELQAIARKADVIFNISGMLADEALLATIPRRVYLDLDPAFIQIWQSEYGIDMRMDAHTHFVTVGQSIGMADCPVPTCGRQWIPTAQPVLLDEWPAANGVKHDALTTVGNWRGYGSVEFQGQHYGQKAHSLRAFFPLPRHTDEKLAPALAIHPKETADLEALVENGWTILDPARVAGTPGNYRDFIQASKGEFGIAKSGYVLSGCGWFSDRSVCYLASGRPVIAQDTGFTRWLPTGEGVIPFTTMEDAVSAIESMNRDYPRHARAARFIAEEHFDSRKVLPRLLQKLDL
jgi:hypothetical protein